MFKSVNHNIGFDTSLIGFVWLSFDGFRWKDLLAVLLCKIRLSKHPDMLIIHLGANDLGKVRTLDLISDIKYSLTRVKCLLPDCIIFVSEIVPRLVWSESNLCFLDKIHKILLISISVNLWLVSAASLIDIWSLKVFFLAFLNLAVVFFSV